jgi:hypothetical protein
MHFTPNSCTTCSRRGPVKTVPLVPLALPHHQYTYLGPYVDIENMFQDCFDAFPKFQDRFKHRQ